MSICCVVHLLVVMSLLHITSRLNRSHQTLSVRYRPAVQKEITQQAWIHQNATKVRAETTAVCMKQYKFHFQGEIYELSYLTLPGNLCPSTSGQPPAGVDSLIIIC
jgi:hypothetical protein